MIFSCLKYFDSTPNSYILATLCATVSAVYLYMNLFNESLMVTHAAAFSIACLGCLVTGTKLQNMICVTSFLILINMKSYTFLCNLLGRFPYSFSIGEAVLVIQGATVFVFVTVQNILLNNTSPSTLFCQVRNIAQN